jgi:hypothetical protein
MDAMFMHDSMWGLGAALAGGIVFAAIGLISGTDVDLDHRSADLADNSPWVSPVAIFAGLSLQRYRST